MCIRDRLYTGKIHGTRRLWSLGGHGNRLVLPGRLHDGQVSWRKMEIDAEYISRENNRLYNLGRWISLEMRPENQTWMLSLIHICSPLWKIPSNMGLGEKTGTAA